MSHFIFLLLFVLLAFCFSGFFPLHSCGLLEHFFFRIQFFFLSASLHIAFLVIAVAIALHKLTTVNGYQHFTRLSEA